LVEIIGLSLLGGAVAVGIKSLPQKSMKKRLVEIMLACKIVTHTNKKVLFPKVVEIKNKPYGKRAVIRLPDGYPSEVVLEKWWIPISEALGKEISVDFDKFLIIDIYNGETSKEILWKVEYV
jgi:hypothetical protein